MVQASTISFLSEHIPSLLLIPLHASYLEKDVLKNKILVSTNKVNEVTSYIMANWGIGEAEELTYGEISLIFCSEIEIANDSGGINYSCPCQLVYDRV